jgi:hypothetical protein
MNLPSANDTKEQTAVAPNCTPAASIDDGPSESATVCPACNYTGDSEFQICPRCGLVVKKYKLRAQRADASQSATATRADAAVNGPDGTTPRSSSKVLPVLLLLAGVILGGVLYQANTNSSLSGPSTTDASGKTEPSSTSAPTPPGIVTNAPSGNATTETVSSNSTKPSDVIPHTLPNHLGITVKKVIFASDVDASDLPVNDLARVPFNGKKIVVNLKMEIPAEKTYQFTGKFYDGGGKLVMNVTSPSTPTLSVSYAWYYHYLDRTDDKPGNWKFVFLVNGEQILEQPIEVVDQ